MMSHWPLRIAVDHGVRVDEAADVDDGLVRELLHLAGPGRLVVLGMGARRAGVLAPLGPADR